MTDDTVALHLSKPQSTISGSPLHRLSCEHGYRTSCSRVDLVIYHMLEALIVGRVQEDLGFELTTGMTVVHHLPPSTLIPLSAQHRQKHRHGAHTYQTRSGCLHWCHALTPCIGADAARHSCHETVAILLVCKMHKACRQDTQSKPAELDIRVQCVGDIVHCDFCEGCGISLPAHHSSYFAHQRFHQMTCTIQHMM